MATKIGRNDACPCGSGKKYKHCCLDKTETAAREAREKAAAEAAAAEPPASAPEHEARHAARPEKTKAPTRNTRGFGKVSLPRKVGGG